MQKLRILNSKEKKEILLLLKEQFGFNEKLDYVFLRSEKDKLYLINSSIADIDLSELNIDTMGLYFAGFLKDGIRLSIEGSQLIGKKCKHHILELGKEQIHDWLKGLDITIKKDDGFYLIKYNNDFFGTGKVKNNNLMNYVPKSRKLKNIND